MLPAEFDRLSFREILLVIRADDDLQKWAWQRAATISTYIRNYAGQKGKGFRMKQPADLFPRLFNRKPFKQRWDEALAQEERYLAQLKESGKI